MGTIIHRWPITVAVAAVLGSTLAVSLAVQAGGPDSAPIVAKKKGGGKGKAGGKRRKPPKGQFYTKQIDFGHLDSLTVPANARGR